jgi:hypothetical protein
MIMSIDPWLRGTMHECPGMQNWHRENKEDKN